MLPTDLAHKWLALAEQQDQLGALAKAHTLRFCAAELETALDQEQNEVLDLQHAAAERGYSADHLARLVRNGEIPNAGRPGAPRIRRADLPSKPKAAQPSIEGATIPSETSVRQIVQSIIAEGVE